MSVIVLMRSVIGCSCREELYVDDIAGHEPSASSDLSASNQGDSRWTP